MKRVALLLLFSLLAGSSVNAQKYISGIVIDSVNQKPMASVTVKNITTQYGAKTNYRGTFTIEVKEGDYLQISHTGFKPRILRMRDVEKIEFLRVALLIGRTELKTVKIAKPLTEYQKDSVQRAEIYRDIFKYKQSKSIFSPVSTIQQMFSKKHKNLRRFKKQVLNMEEQKFIDSRYTPELAAKITKLSGDDLAYFMNAYPMEIDYARTASNLEIYAWVSRNWKEYQKKNQGKE